MSARNILMAAGGSADDKLYVDDVFSAYTYTGNGSTQTINNGIDLAGKGGLVWVKHRDGSYGHMLFDTARTFPYYYLQTNGTGAQGTGVTNTLTAFNSNGFSLGSLAFVNSNNASYVSWTFRKSPKFFDVVTWTGNGAAGRQLPHTLGIAPGMIVVKRTDSTGDWNVWHSSLNNAFGSGVTKDTLFLNMTAAAGSANSLFVGNLIDASNFGVGSGGLNSSGATYVAYLFASLPGISKVGSYTGNGATQTIDCGFSTGARFILIKRTDSTGDWYVWDSVRGIVSANDPHLSLNTTAAEVTTDDSIDPDASGFIVNQVAATNINVTGATYIFLAVS